MLAPLEIEQSRAAGIVRRCAFLFVGFVAACTAPNQNQATQSQNGSANPPPAELVAFALDETFTAPPSTTNVYVDDPAAQALGRAIFFDKRFSADATVACVSCHDPAKGFSDSRTFSVGVGGKLGARHSLPVNGVALQTFMFWDGRADSVWSQPLKAIENPNEMAQTRVGVAHVVAASYAPQYESVFGPLPDVSTYPASAMPGMSEWDALSAPQQDAAQRVFANVGKALEAYERQILCTNTRFDQWVRGTVTPTASELTGAQTFVERHCTNCHTGRAFSDGLFHNIGIGSGTATPDQGRADAAALLMADPFNGAGAYSDDRATGAQKLSTVSQERGTIGAFRTPTLRGAGQRSPLAQRGSQSTLFNFIQNTYERPHLEPGAVGTLDPKLQGVGGRDNNDQDIVAFIHMLDCPPLPASLLAP